MVRDDRTALEALQVLGFDPTSQVLLQPDGDSCRARHVERTSTSDSTPEPGKAASFEVTVADYRPEQVVIEADLDEPGYLVLSDAWYPGWRAMVDGDRVCLCRANLLFRAVALEPGQHRVVFAFRPFTVVLGAIVSMIGIILLAFVPRFVIRYLS
jgi:hypothetical protein